MERMSLEVSEQLLRVVGSVLDIRQVFPRGLGDRPARARRTTA